ncbi:Cysteine-tRNA ligase [Candidatus Saccharibacteria bacterium RAAC3_TM7_1]|nr:Cysteine-tRNA ligase [Candidatus Saccharibacteria bacterium RAAC3_TM7_1]
MKLHNTLTGTKDEFTPLVGNTVKLYTCGLTVYSQPHIGNWVAYIYWDVLVRTLRALDYKVERVQNITDVGHLTDDADAGEDKMLKSALKEGKTAWDVAQKYIDIADHEAYDTLKLLRPEHMPRATDYIAQQVALVEELEKKGFTYQIKDGIYFDTDKLKDYGKLARLDIKGLHFGARVADTGKKNPTDFALWKFSPKDQQRDMEWDSPWGKGFPGWHLECSAMAMDILGEQIDIHTGGIDHIPVHHTNEIAQTEALTSKPFSHFWVHANHIKVNGTKMSKSLDNIYTLDDIVNKGYDLNAFKLLVLSKHYRTEGNFTWEILDASANRLKNWQAAAVLRHQTHDTLQDDDEKDTDASSISLLATPHVITEALADDLDTPRALTLIDEAFNHLETRSLERIHHNSLIALLEAINELLGIDLLTSTPDIDDKSKQLILERQRARENKDWRRSDELRDALIEKGVAVRDTLSGSVWYYL